MARRDLLAKIHIAKKELCLDDDTYRYMLRNIFMVKSARDLSNVQLFLVIKHFESQGWKPKKKDGEKKKYDDQKGDAYSATPRQKRMIEAMWHDIYKGNDEAKHLRQFLFRVAKVNDLRFLEKKSASDVVEAIKAISRRRNGQTPIVQNEDRKENYSAVSQM